MNKPKTINKNPITAPNGVRHDKSQWETTIKTMLDDGKLYRDIAAHLGTSPSTVCRFVWAKGWANVTTHRATTRTKIIKATKHQDDVARGLRSETPEVQP